MGRRVPLLLGVAVLLGAWLAPAASAQQATIGTFDAAAQASTEFTAGQRMVVLGRNFGPARGTVTITFRQQQDVVLGTFQIAEDRTFRADTDLPGEAAEGQVTIEAVSGESRATSVIQVVGEVVDPDARPAPAPGETATPTAVAGPVTPAPGDPTSPGPDAPPLDVDDRSLVDRVGDNPWLLLLVLLALVAVALGVILLLRRRRMAGPPPPTDGGLAHLEFDEEGEGPMTQVLLPLEDDEDDLPEEDEEPPRGGSSSAREGDTSAWEGDEEEFFFREGRGGGARGSGGRTRGGGRTRRSSSAADRLREDVQGWTVDDPGED